MPFIPCGCHDVELPLDCEAAEEAIVQHAKVCPHRLDEYGRVVGHFWRSFRELQLAKIANLGD